MVIWASTVSVNSDRLPSTANISDSVHPLDGKLRQTPLDGKHFVKDFVHLWVALCKIMDWALVERMWDKWAPVNVGFPDLPLKAALLINYDPTGPSRLLSTIVHQEGIKADPMELSQFVSFVKGNKLQRESFFIGLNQYIVTTIHESRFSARSLNTSKPSGDGAIVMRTAKFILVGLYEGSIGSASRAMAALDLYHGQLVRRNL